MSHASYQAVSTLIMYHHCARLTTEMDMVARANGSPIMLASLNLLRLAEFMLCCFLRDGEYRDL